MNLVDPRQPELIPINTAPIVSRFASVAAARVSGMTGVIALLAATVIDRAQVPDRRFS
jgi:hypothetical protein